MSSRPRRQSNTATPNSSATSTKDNAAYTLSKKRELFACGGAFFFQTGVPGAFGPQLWEPCQVAVPGPQTTVCCGANFTLSVDEHGHVYQWGIDADEVVRVPTKVAGLQRPIVAIACGRKHSLAMTDKNEVFSWGLGTSGQLGHGDAPMSPIIRPKQINCLKDRHRDPPGKIFAGGNTSGIVTKNNLPLLWGSNKFGQCASGTLRPVLKPRQVTCPVLNGVKVRALCLSRQHSGLVTTRGKVFTWGATNYGRLGVSTSEVSTNSRLVLTPTKIDIPFVTSLVAGDFHMVALSKESHVYTWGMGSDGQGGHGHFLHMRTPKRVEMLVGYKIEKIAAGAWHSLAITDNHDVYTWGSGAAGQLGHGKLRREIGENLFDGEYNINYPRWVQALEGFDCMNAACGGVHSIFQLQMRSSSQILQRISQRGSSMAATAPRRAPYISTPASQADFDAGTLDAADDELDEVVEDDIDFIFSLCRHGRHTEVAELIEAGYPVETAHPKTGNTLAMVAAQEGNKRVLRLCLLAVGGVEHISSGYVNHRGLTVFDVCEESGHAKLALWLRGKISVTNTPATGDDASTVAKEGGNEELEYVEPQAEVEAGFYDEHNYDDTYSSPWNAGYNEGERRIDPSDGIAYTYDEFVQYYGEDAASEHWYAAEVSTQEQNENSDVYAGIEADIEVEDLEPSPDATESHVQQGLEQLEVDQDTNEAVPLRTQTPST